MYEVIPSRYYGYLLPIAALYRGDLPYHNFPHALRTVIEIVELLRRCERYGVKVDGHITILAGLLHDAGAGTAERTEYASDEEYAVHLAGPVLRQLGETQAVITRVQQCILSSHRDASFTATEEMVLRAADLAGMRGTYGGFLHANILLKKEWEMLNREMCSWERWKKITRGVIEFYLSQDIRLTPLHDVDGVSEFHAATRANLDRFLLEPDFVLCYLEV